MKDENRTADRDRLADSFALSTRPVVTVDLEKYQAMLATVDLSPQQKEDFLRAMWSIMMTFVELGFGVHPLQEVCGQNGITGHGRLKDVFDRVESGKSEPINPTMDSGPKGGLEAE